MPPIRVKVGPLYVDASTAHYLDQLWRSKVDEANKKGEKIKTFSQFLGQFLDEAVREDRSRRRIIDATS